MYRLAVVMSGLALVACNPSDGAPKADAPSAPAGAAQSAPARIASMPSESREFRDWWAVCDNGNACSAFGFSTDPDIAWVRIAMAPGPDAQPEITYGAWDASVDGTTPQTLSLVVDGRTFGGDMRVDPNLGAEFGQLRANARDAVSAMASGRAIAVRAGDAVAISPAGASAALLWIDERQGRLNTPTALLRRGTQPATGVPAAPALPPVRAAAAADQTGFGSEGQTLPRALRNLPALRDCMAFAAQSPGVAADIQSARLDARTELWAVPCDSGAYNVMHQWFLTGPGGTSPRPLTLMGSDEGRNPVQGDDWPDNMTVNGSYDPANRSLTAFYKGRGLGDCGTTQTWIWTGEQFALAGERAMGECFAVPFGQWPTTWRSSSEG